MTVSTAKSATGWRRFRLTAEPIMASLFFALSISGVVQTDLIIRQACQTYGLDVDNCTTNDKNEETYDEVHKTASTIGLYNIIIATVPGCFGLLTTPWSETNGRKPILIVGLTGFTVSQGILTYMATLPDIDPYYLLLSSIPILATGGIMLIAVTSTIYVVDISAPNDRSLRLAVLTVIGQAGTVAGSLLAPTLSAMGYEVVYGTNTAITFACLVYVILFLPESIDVKEENKMKLFTVSHVVDTCKTFCKKRPNHVRGIVIGLIIFTCMGIAVVSGEPDVQYLSVKKEFNWTISDYSDYSAVCQGVQAFFTLSGVYVGVNLLGFGEATLIIIMQIMIAVGSTIMASIPTPISFYVTSQFRCFSGCLMALMKGYMSRIVPHDEIGKVMSFGYTFEAFMPQLGTLMYSQFYNEVVGTSPFSVYYLSAGISIVQVFCAFVIWFMGRGVNVSDCEKPQPSDRSPEKPADGNTSDNKGDPKQPNEENENL